jgi:hypothetical protein
MREIHYCLVYESGEIIKDSFDLEEGKKIRHFKDIVKERNSSKLHSIDANDLQVYNNENLLEYNKKIDNYGKTEAEALVVVVPPAGGVGKFV